MKNCVMVDWLSVLRDDVACRDRCFLGSGSCPLFFFSFKEQSFSYSE